MTQAEKCAAMAANNEAIAANVPKVYKAGQSSMVDESKIIPKTVSGSYISVDDVSEIPHSVGCKVESVNWCPEEVESGYYYDSNGTPTGANARYIRILPFNVKPLTTYTLSSNLVIYTIWEFGADGGIRRISAATNSYKVTFTTSDNCTELRIALFNTSGTADTTAFEYAMLNRGTTALPYTPFVKPEEVKVTRCEENMLKYPHLHTTKTVNGITFTDNGDGTVTANGTATADATYAVANYNLKKGTTYTFSGCPVGGSKTTYYLNPRGYSLDVGYGITLTPTYDFKNNVEIVIKSGTTVSNLLFKPQWELGDKATKYKPYNGQTLTPSADGTVEGMTSVSPYMNVFSDTEGVNIEATYNKSWGMQTEYDRRWDRIQDYGNKTTYTGFFAGSSWNENSLNPKYVAKPTGNEAYQMFMFCNRGGKTKIDYRTIKEKIDLSGVVNAPNLFQDAVIDYIDLDLPNCVNLSNGFSEGWSAGKKTTISIYITEKCTSLTGCFNSCTALANLTFKEGSVIATSINLQHSPLIKESITSVVNALSSTATGLTLTLKLSAVNKAFETSTGANDGSTSAEFAALVATKTNWTITMI
ncbi:MAG: hypothetical protein IJF32_11360 [Oscillospiraceae bacterium]|nr:hypothetical protein [Oscillospiraceae bacterium]